MIEEKFKIKQIKPNMKPEEFLSPFFSSSFPKHFENLNTIVNYTKGEIVIIGYSDFEILRTISKLIQEFKPFQLALAKLDGEILEFKH